MKNSNDTIGNRTRDWPLSTKIKIYYELQSFGTPIPNFIEIHLVVPRNRNVDRKVFLIVQKRHKCSHRVLFSLVWPAKQQSLTVTWHVGTYCRATESCLFITGFINKSCKHTPYTCSPFFITRNKTRSYLISNFRRVLNVVCFLLCNFPASEFYMPTFRNALSVPSS